MKSSLDHLLKNKQEELKDIIKTIINAEKKIEMIILFGSYARGDFVDRDTTTEDRMTYEYRSDFDILVVVSDEGVAQDYGIWSKIKDTILKDEAIQTPVRLVVEDVIFLNHKLAIGHYFYSDIKKEGAVLYDSGKYTLDEAKELTKQRERKLSKRIMRCGSRKQRALLLLTILY